MEYVMIKVLRGSLWVFLSVFLTASAWAQGEPLRRNSGASHISAQEVEMMRMWQNLPDDWRALQLGLPSLYRPGELPGRAFEEHQIQQTLGQTTFPPVDQVLSPEQVSTYLYGGVSIPENEVEFSKPEQHGYGSGGGGLPPGLSGEGLSGSGHP
jgi:hypothetical protein